MPKAKRAALNDRGTPALAADVADLIKTLRSLLDPYRPELHYMRGPGPAWRAKHEPAPAAVEQLRAVLRHAKA